MQDIKLVLQKFASNIIFSNGLVDPYSSGGYIKYELLLFLAFRSSSCVNKLDFAALLHLIVLYVQGFGGHIRQCSCHLHKTRYAQEYN